MVILRDNFDFNFSLTTFPIVELMTITHIYHIIYISTQHTYIRVNARFFVLYSKRPAAFKIV